MSNKVFQLLFGAPTIPCNVYAVHLPYTTNALNYKKNALVYLTRTTKKALQFGSITIDL